MGLGAIVWDHKGYLIVAKSLTKLENFEPVVVEALIWEPYMLQNFEKI
jgi:hypothetical protein